ncbi:MAG: metallophosphoesterase family protein [Elainellaceae cyanobacterium]
MVQNRQIVIGDVHGQYDGLVRLLDAIGPTSDDRVYFLGDLIDRGPKSAQVLSLVKQQGYVSLSGNHEQMLLEAFPNGKAAPSALAAWLYSGGQATLDSFDNIYDLLAQLSWIDSWPTYLDLGNVWLVHAGVNPDLRLEEQTKQDLCWIRQKFHSTRRPYFNDKLIITGHTITFTLPDISPGALVRGEGWLDIDTGAYHPRSGWLTGLDIHNQRVYQVNIYTKAERRLPLEEAAVKIDPALIPHRRPLARFAG